MSATSVRLTPLDDSFLAVESPTAHMHIGWASIFEAPAGTPRPGFEEIRRHIAARLGRAPRFRQRLSSAPLSLDSPSWVDDSEFDLSRHVKRSRSREIDPLVASCMSKQLDRERPLWEIQVADSLADGRIGVVGKAHHCMVDGIAAVELASVLLDPTADVEPSLGAADGGSDGWHASPAPSTPARFGGALTSRAREQVELARTMLGLVGSPQRLVSAPGRAAGAAAGTLARTLRPANPIPPLNEPISSQRALGRVERRLDDLARVKRRFGATINDVYLAAAAGAARRLLARRNVEQMPLKTMVPVSIREDGELDQLGNRISFMFVDLPCDEPDPERRLRRVQAQTDECKLGGDPGVSELALRMVGYAPRTLRRLVARTMSSPRMFNLVVSNIPGPREPTYMLGCRLREAYPIVPLADRHALSIGMTSVGEHACFGLYADRDTLGDVDEVARDLARSLDELVALE